MSKTLTEAQVTTANFVLNKYLAETALNLAEKFRAPSALLPYWGRLSFLRVMAELPEEHVSRYKLLVLWRTGLRWISSTSS
jgi:hypothetical protein